MYTNKDFILKRRQKDFIVAKMPEDVLNQVMDEFTEKFKNQLESDEEREWLENRSIEAFKKLNIVIPSEEELEKLEEAADKKFRDELAKEA